MNSKQSHDTISIGYELTRDCWRFWKKNSHKKIPNFSKEVRILLHRFQLQLLTQQTLFLDFNVISTPIRIFFSSNFCDLHCTSEILLKKAQKSEIWGDLTHV
jgi:hypothetical protein